MPFPELRVTRLGGVDVGQPEAVELRTAIFAGEAVVTPRARQVLCQRRPTRCAGGETRSPNGGKALAGVGATTMKRLRSSFAVAAGAALFLPLVAGAQSGFNQTGAFVGAWCAQ